LHTNGTDYQAATVPSQFFFTKFTSHTNRYKSMDQRIINLFDEYTHKPLSRDTFLKRLAKLAGSTSAAVALLPLLEVNYANAATIAETDEDIITEDIHYNGDGSTMGGYLARPKKAGKYGSVLVIHENRGLNPHTKDIARRIAKAGYIALAGDALAPFGGTPENEDEARAAFAKIDAQKNLNNFLKGLDYLKARPDSNGNRLRRILLGWCIGKPAGGSCPRITGCRSLLRPPAGSRGCAKNKIFCTAPLWRS
jgi:carboxymethylenebutenolidase